MAHIGINVEKQLQSKEIKLRQHFCNCFFFNVAKCNLGEVKLERIGLRLSPIAVRDMRGGPLGSCRTSLGTCSLSYIALLLCLLIVVDQLFLFCEALRILAPSPPSLPGGWCFLK